MKLPQQFSERMQKIQKVDLTAFILGTALLFFSGSILIAMHLHDDLVITKGHFSVSDISLILHASAALSLLLSPLHRRIFGALSTTFAFMVLLLTGYMYTQNPLQSVIGLLTLLFMNFLLLGPSLGVLLTSFKIRK